MNRPYSFCIVLIAMMFAGCTLDDIVDRGATCPPNGKEGMTIVTPAIAAKMGLPKKSGKALVRQVTMSAKKTIPMNTRRTIGVNNPESTAVAPNAPTA